jgi:hypothetical protein
MNISYKKIISFINENKKILIYSEIFTLILGATYFALSPKIYEAYFEVNIARIKIESIVSTETKIRWDSITQGLALKRALQAPMGYSKDLIVKCFGTDTNKNRKNLVNSVQFGVANSGNVLSVTMRLQGLDNLNNCVDAYANYVIDNLNRSLEDKIKDNAQWQSKLVAEKIIGFNKANLLIPVRLADGYVRPEKMRVLALSLLLGFLIAFSMIILKEKYRAT